MSTVLTSSPTAPPATLDTLLAALAQALQPNATAPSPLQSAATEICAATGARSWVACVRDWVASGGDWVVRSGRRSPALRTGARRLFSMLPFGPDAADRVALEHGIYLPRSGRINLAGLRDVDVECVSGAVAAVLANWRIKTSRLTP
jgi:hypothetical protein